MPRKACGTLSASAALGAAEPARRHSNVRSESRCASVLPPPAPRPDAASPAMARSTTPTARGTPRASLAPRRPTRPAARASARRAEARGLALAAHAARPGRPRRRRQSRTRESRPPVRPLVGGPLHRVRHPLVRGAITDTVRARRGATTSATGVRRTSSASRTSAARRTGRAPTSRPDPGPSPTRPSRASTTLRIVGTLPDRERIALVRTLVEGDSAAEVAKELGVSSDRVYTLVNTGCSRLRRRAA